MSNEARLQAPIDPNTRPRRSEVLANTPFANRLGDAFERPDATVIEQVTADPRIEYFEAPEPEMSLGEIALQGLIGEEEKPERSLSDVEDLIGGALAQRIAEAFPGQELVVRGTFTSINGAAHLKDGGTVLDTQDVVATGDERSRGWIRGTDFRHGDESKPPKVDFFTMQSALEARAFADAMAADEVSGASIFPTVLVYDAAQLQKRPEDRYHYDIPEGSNPVLAAYVIDRPVDAKLLA